MLTAEDRAGEQVIRKVDLLEMNDKLLWSQAPREGDMSLVNGRCAGGGVHLVLGWRYLVSVRLCQELAGGWC